MERLKGDWDVDAVGTPPPAADSKSLPFRDPTFPDKAEAAREDSFNPPAIAISPGRAFGKKIGGGSLL